MKRWAAALLAASGLWGQQFKFNVGHLESKASNVVDISLNGSMLQIAGKFLDSKDPDEAKAKKLVSGLEGIFIKSFEFKSDGAWTQSDLDNIRNQLKAPEWSRIVGVRSPEEGENADVYVRSTAGKVSGVAVLVTSAREFTIVNIAGPVDLDSLVDLGGHFGVPKLKKEKEREKEKKFD